MDPFLAGIFSDFVSKRRVADLNQHADTAQLEQKVFEAMSEDRVTQASNKEHNYSMWWVKAGLTLLSQYRYFWFF